MSAEPSAPAPAVAAAPVVAAKSKGTNEVPITLFGFPKPANGPSNSGFCNKLEAYLRFSDLNYENKEGNVLKAPKKKLPYVTYGDDTVSDTRFIIQYLDREQGKFNSKGNLDTVAGLTDAEKAVSNAFQAQAEELLYFAVVHERFARDANAAAVKEEAFGNVPWIIRGLLTWYVRRSLKGALVGQGIGRHSDNEVDEITEGALDDIETKLRSNGSSGPWFNGAKGPCTVDATIYGMLSTVLSSPSNPVARSKVLERPEVIKFIRHVTSTYYPEYEELLATIDGKN